MLWLQLLWIHSPFKKNVRFRKCATDELMFSLRRLIIMEKNRNENNCLCSEQARGIPSLRKTIRIFNNFSIMTMIELAAFWCQLQIDGFEGSKISCKWYVLENVRPINQIRRDMQLWKVERWTAISLMADDKRMWMWTWLISTEASKSR